VRDGPAAHCQKYTVSRENRATLFSTNSGVYWAIFTLFVPAKTGTNTLQYIYLRAWWRHNCVTLHVTKLWLRQCYLQFQTTVADCVRSKRLFATFTESGPVIVFSDSCWEILLSIFIYRKSITLPQFFNLNFTFRTRHI